MLIVGDSKVGRRIIFRWPIVWIATSATKVLKAKSAELEKWCKLDAREV